MDNIQPVVNPVSDQNGGGDPVNAQVPNGGVPAGTPAPSGQPGEKTDPNLLLDSLQAERERRRIAEEKSRLLEAELEKARLNSNPAPTSDEMSDEAKTIMEKHVGPLQQTVTQLQDQIAVGDLIKKFPQLVSLESEFETYRKDYPRHKLENVAKLFLNEKGLLGNIQRTGLEGPTGGPKVTNPGKMTADQVKELRTTNYREYQRKVMAGELDDI